jgi:type II secretory pathway component PulF
MKRFCYREDERGSEVPAPFPTIELIPQRGLLPFSDEDTIRKDGPGPNSPKRVSLDTLAVWMRQMANLVNASIPANEAVRMTRPHCAAGPWGRLISDLEKKLNDGQDLSTAMRNEEIFPSYFSPVLRAGEESGRLGESLAALADYLERDLYWKNTIIGSLVYPGFVLAVGCLGLAILTVFVVPRITALFADVGQTLPLPTVIALALVKMFIILPVILTGVAVAAAAQRDGGVTKLSLRKIREHVARLPVVNQFIKEKGELEFYRMMAMLSKNNVPMERSLGIIAHRHHGGRLSDAVTSVLKKVLNGSSVGTAMITSGYFDEISAGLISVNERAGRLSLGFEAAARSKEHALNSMMKTLMTVTGPAVLTGIIIVIGGIMAAVLLPVFRIGNLFQ